MRNGTKAAVTAAILATGTALLPSVVAAQDVDIDGTGVRRSPAVVLHGGWFGVEADSLEAGPVVGVALEFPLADWLVLTPSVDRRTVTWPGDDQRAEWLLDFAIQAEVAIDRITPFAGLSLGTAFDFRDERVITEEYVVATYGAMAGARWSFTDRLGVKAAARWRFIDGLESGALATTAGIRWAF